MTKPELGTKRICAGCNAKFYDLHKTEIICPKCEAVFAVPKPVPERPRRAVEPRPVAVPIAAAPEKAPAGDDATVALVNVDGEQNADGEKAADGEKEADAGVPLLEEIDED